jgi:hypothetical protein
MTRARARGVNQVEALSVPPRPKSEDPARPPGAFRTDPGHGDAPG